jgi:hypothetical protein
LLRADVPLPLLRTAPSNPKLSVDQTFIQPLRPAGIMLVMRGAVGGKVLERIRLA